MKDWTINNHSKRQLIIQSNHDDISIIEPLRNGSFKILAEFNALNTDYIQVMTTHLLFLYMRKRLVCLIDLHSQFKVSNYLIYNCFNYYLEDF